MRPNVQLSQDVKLIKSSVRATTAEKQTNQYLKQS